MLFLKNKSLENKKNTIFILFNKTYISVKQNKNYVFVSYFLFQDS